MADVIAAIQSAIEIVGKLRALSKKVEDAEFKMLLADLSNELADAKLEVAKLKTHVAALQEENQGLTARMNQRESAKPAVVDGAYTFPDDQGHFCTACFDTRQQRVRLSRLASPFDRFGKWQCPACQATLS